MDAHDVHGEPHLVATWPDPPEWVAKLFSVGITGTNGKTSTAAFLAASLEQPERPVVRVSTVGTFLGGSRLDVEPNYSGLLRSLQIALEHGAQYAVLEASSETLARGLGAKWPFRAAVFTNLTQDHLDAHPNPEHYFASKAQLFHFVRPPSIVVLNGCDEVCPLLEEVAPPQARVFRYGVTSRGTATNPLHVEATNTVVDTTGTTATVAMRSPFVEESLTIRTRAVGDIFVENALAAFSAAVALGIPCEKACEALSKVRPPSGRFEIIARNPCLVIDYAHTPDALARTVHTARRLCSRRLTVVFGAGGDRDRGKRPLMGAATRGADRVIITSDNPRSEEPAAIAAAIRAGVPDETETLVELDRGAAIRQAIIAAHPEDVVLIAGKGHETEQQLGSERHRFSDHDVALAALAAMRSAGSG